MFPLSLLPSRNSGLFRIIHTLVVLKISKIVRLMVQPQVLRKTQVPPSGGQSCRHGVQEGLIQLAVSRGKNCILGFRLKPHWFHQKLHTRIMDETTLVSNCILGFRMKPKWFQIYRDFYRVQKLEYAIFCETSCVSSKI